MEKTIAHIGAQPSSSYTRAQCLCVRVYTNLEGGCLPEQKCNYLMMEHDSVLDPTAEYSRQQTEIT